MPHAIWIPVIILFYFFLGYASYRNNVTNGGWVYLIWLLGLFPGWAIVSKYSNNLLFDGILFDTIMGASYVFGICYFTGAWKSLSLLSTAGLVLTVIGLIIFKCNLST